MNDAGRVRVVPLEAGPGPEEASPAVVAVEGLAKAYDRTGTVFAGVAFEVPEGQRLALIGANGAGKSTLLKCLIGLMPPSAGRLRVLGEEFGPRIAAAQRTRLRRQTGFVFQRHGLVGRLSVLSNVVHGMLGAPGSWRGFAQGIAPAEWRERAMAALEQVSLAEKAGARADTLSGGQAQRVAIARALVRRPRLLIADEPAASLDPAAGEEVMTLFSGLAQRHGITLIFTSHDMAQAVRHSDRIVALRRGGLGLDRASRAVTERELAEVFA